MLRKLKNFLLRNTQYGKTRYLNFLYRYDMARYAAHSGMNENNPETMATEMRILIHAIEKGLSLSHIKKDFGKEKILKLLQLYEAYENLQEGKDLQVLELVRSVLRVYEEHRLAAGEDTSFLPEGLMKVCRQQPVITGTILVDGTESADFAAVAKRRHSLRSFAPAPLSVTELTQAVQLAQTAPSACNRQASRVFACMNKDKVDKIMAMHGGMNGFDKPAAILAVTGDLNAYLSEYERNTVFVDGGIFLMNLLYALDHYDIAACPIIWGTEPDNDKILAELLNIPKSYTVISLVAAGKRPEKGAKAAFSQKRPTETILNIIQ